jgi:hypothetical protein
MVAKSSVKKQPTAAPRRRRPNNRTNSYRSIIRASDRRINNLLRANYQVLLIPNLRRNTVTVLRKKQSDAAPTIDSKVNAPRQI